MSVINSAELRIVVRPVVLHLLEQAAKYCSEAEGQHAEAFYKAALVADLTSLAQIEYAAFLAVQGDSQQALTLLLAAWEESKKQQSAKLRHLACHNLAAVYRDLGESERAFQFQQLAISAEMDICNNELSSELGVSEESRLGQALDDLSQNHLYQAQASLLQLEKSSVDPEMRAVCHLNLARIAQKVDSHAKALAHAQVAFTISKSNHLAPTVLHALEMLSELLTQAGHWREAEQCLEEACRLSNSLNSTTVSGSLMQKRERLKHALGFLNADPLLN